MKTKTTMDDVKLNFQEYTIKDIECPCCKHNIKIEIGTSEHIDNIEIK